MELNGKLTGDVMRTSGGKAVIMLEVDKHYSAVKLFEKYNEKKLDIEIKQHREKRSLNANAYMWVLCGKIAEKLNITKEEVYRRNVKDVGVYYDDEIEPENVKRRRTAWELIGTGWFTERVDFTKDGNKEIVRFYYGSSLYDSKQMSRLIDNVVQDAQSLDIETRTPNEIAEMLSVWGARDEEQKGL